MEKIPVQNGIRFLSVMAALLLGGALARADDFDGSWIMNANGWKFTLKLEQKGDVVTGTMTGINNDQKSTIEGKIVGNEITFTRVGEGQDYRGFLFTEDPSEKALKQAMAGTAKTGDVTFGWYATR